MSCFVAHALCDWFGQAKDMVQTTSEYYAKFTSTISAGALKKWTQEIETAESRRLKNPKAMDIMCAHQPESSSDPQGRTKLVIFTRQSVATASTLY